MASLLTPGAFGGADAGPPSILAPSQKAQPPSILNQGPPSILAPAPTGPSKPPAPQKSAQKKKKPQKAKQPDPERTTVPVGDAVAPEPAMARKDKKEKQQKKKQPKKEPKKASPKSEEQKEAAEPSSPPHYAFSAFQISPEPSSLPKPSFSFGKKKT